MCPGEREREEPPRCSLSDPVRLKDPFPGQTLTLNARHAGTGLGPGRRHRRRTALCRRWFAIKQQVIGCAKSDKSRKWQYHLQRFSKLRQGRQRHLGYGPQTDRKDLAYSFTALNIVCFWYNAEQAGRFVTAISRLRHFQSGLPCCPPLLPKLGSTSSSPSSSSFSALLSCSLPSGFFSAFAASDADDALTYLAGSIGSRYKFIRLTASQNERLPPSSWAAHTQAVGPS